jgi:hypothetical protein
MLEEAASLPADLTERSDVAAEDSYRRFIPTIPESPFDRRALDLLAAIPPGITIAASFGRPDCPPGTAAVEPIGCCWAFGSGATQVIERLSLGTANAWRVGWLCEPEADPAAMDSPTSAFVDDPGGSPSTHPWFVRHPDVGLSVFPTSFDAVLHGASRVADIPAGTLVGRISYAPNGKMAFDPHNLSYAVAHAYTGFELMFGCMKEAASRRFGMPEYFLGDAPEKRMATFLTHFGFDVIDNGEIGATVFAPVERVRASLDEQRERAARLRERANRESAATDASLVLP